MTVTMTRLAGLSLATWTLAAACGSGDEDRPVPATKDGRIRLVFSADAQWDQSRAQTEMESALTLHPEILVCYAHNDPMARGAQLAAEQAGRGEISFIGIDALPDEGVEYIRQGILQATFLYPTGGAEAVDLAILSLRGVEIPKDIVLGTRIYTTENLERGGDAIEAPGTEALAQLRREHEKLLLDPETDDVFRIGLSQCNLGEPWRQQMNQDVRERAEELAHQVELIEKDAQNDSTTQARQVDELVAEGARAILISPKEEVALVPAVDRAMAAGVHVIVLDRKLGGSAHNYTCFLGGDNRAIGRAAGRYVDRILEGRKGDIIEIRGLMTSSPARERHEGFVQALGLVEKR